MIRTTTRSLGDPYDIDDGETHLSKTYGQQRGIG